jgi:hypothetical protein
MLPIIMLHQFRKETFSVEYYLLSQVIYAPPSTELRVRVSGR